MEKLYVLGTGNALVTKCYNTCFTIEKDGEHFLVDTGGGNGIMTALEKVDIHYNKIHHIFISHEHCDHLLGVVWLIRIIATKMKNSTYEGNLNIYCHSDLINTIMTISKLTLQKKFYNMIGERIILVPLEDGDIKEILGYHVKFFDIHSTKVKQYGFTTMLYNKKKLTFCGDEPYNENYYDYVKGSNWLLHEAFCLEGEVDIFKPYDKYHCTVKEACEAAQKLKAENLILWHTEDKNLEKRKELYTIEGEKYYKGNIHVPYDLEILEL